MKKFLRYSIGVIAALVIIYCWPVHKHAKLIHTFEGGTFENPTDISAHATYVEWNDPMSNGGYRRIHFQGSYWIEYDGQ